MLLTKYKKLSTPFCAFYPNFTLHTINHHKFLFHSVALLMAIRIVKQDIVQLILLILTALKTGG